MPRIIAHPGAILQEELKPIGLSADALATALCVPVGRIAEIIHEKRFITLDTAICLAEYSGHVQPNGGRSRKGQGDQEAGVEGGVRLTQPTPLRDE